MVSLNDGIPSTPQQSRTAISVLDIDFECRLRRERHKQAILFGTSSCDLKRANLTPVLLDEDSRGSKRRCVAACSSDQENSDMLNTQSSFHLPIRRTTLFSPRKVSSSSPFVFSSNTPKRFHNQELSFSNLRPRNLRLDFETSAKQQDRLETSMSSIRLSEPLPYMPL